LRSLIKNLRVCAPFVAAILDYSQNPKIPVQEEVVLRFVILAILIFLAYRLVAGSFRSGKKDERKPELADGDPTVSDILVEDPVCHTLIPRQQSIHLRHHGENVYFCSEECCDIFLKKGEDT
jgi:YHS domain-containing protein